MFQSIFLTMGRILFSGSCHREGRKCMAVLCEASKRTVSFVHLHYMKWIAASSYGPLRNDTCMYYQFLTNLVIART